jgi:hypothetical protein
MQELIDYLRGCPKGFVHDYGLCYSIVQFNGGFVHESAHKAMRKVVLDWKHFSGDLSYPIKGDDCSARDMFNKTRNMYAGEYGRMRIELANLIADELEKQLCKS